MVVIEAATVAAAIGWFVSPALSFCFDKIKTFLEKKCFEKSDIETDLKNINTNLGRILSIMCTVEKQRILDPNEVLLVQEIKNAVYGAEDFIDELEYKLLHIKASDGASSSSGAIDVDESFKEMVKEVRESLDRAKELATTLLDLTIAKKSGNIQFIKQENRLLTSSLISDKIIGREIECKLLTEYIFEEVEGPPAIISIIGQAGIGKTTLAQMIFNDSRIRDHFDKTIWLTDNFDKVRLTKEMLKDVCENFSTKNASFNKLQTKLETVLAFKKILLMLDDVWYIKDDKQKYSYEKGWLEFLAPLKNAKAGSKIILTTQQDLVVSSLASFGSIRTISLRRLSPDESWSLFKLKAFDGGNSDNHKYLEPIGKRIVNKLNGSALAIKVVGTYLRGKYDEREWEKTLNDNLLDKGDIMEILCRGYEHLPEHLQRCFAYCSLFPKGYYLKRDRLVHMWIAHGFVQPRKRERLEDVGKSYFNELIARSFIQVIKRGNKEYYVMHDLMNDLACYVSKGECYILEEGDPIENLGSIRHLSVHRGAINILRNVHSLDNLRTLIFISCTWLGKMELIAELFRILKGIRVLDIDIQWGLEMLPHVDKYKHLRYLSFRYNDNFNLASHSFSKLHHLAVLFIRRDRTHNKEHYYHLSLLQRICKMSSLVFIDISKSFNVDVDERVKLHSLLRGGSLFLDASKQEGRELGLLGDINNIKGKVEISRLETVASREEATKAQLSSKEHVIELRLVWFDSSSEVDMDKHNKVLEALGPNRSIERLVICGYPGDASPSWLGSNFLSRIKEIYLDQCHRLKMLPALGQLPQLKDLVIKSMNAVRKIGIEFHGDGTFPSLEEVRISSLWNLEEWSFSCGVQSFPKLYRLKIDDCGVFVGPKCNGFPALQELHIMRCNAVIMKAQLDGYGCLPVLTRLDIVDCKGIIKLEGWDELVTVKILRIINCPNLKSLPEMECFYSLEELEIEDCDGIITLESMSELVTLKSLRIRCCGELLYLPKMEYFYSLVFLEIENCPKLWSLPKKGLPVSLRTFNIGGSLHHDLNKEIRSKSGPEWNKVAAVSGCRLIHPEDSDDDEWYIL